MFFRFFYIFLMTISFAVKGICQNYLTKTGFIGFYSKTPLEDIKAENNQVYAVLDPVSHHIAFAVLLKGFIFTKELMQEHFNENYVESDKFPKATFSGICSGEMDFSKEGIYQVVIKGDLALHGVTKAMETTAQLEVKKDHINGTSVFKLKPEDFNISIPSIVRDKITSEITVKVKIEWVQTK
ncbi:MAG TPA: YceI family protein [Puia sp.]|nr:YceI family protein [Puia sp.]